MRGRLLATASCVLLTACGGGSGETAATVGDTAAAMAQPSEPASASATLRDAAGQEVGRVALTEGEHGVVVAAELDGVPAGTHAMHIHGAGACEPPFQSAGGHAAAEGKAHGILAPGGMHAGDLPNVHVPESGALRVEAFAWGATLGAAADRLPLLDADGSAVVIHAGADDYATDPAGAAGDRIACGVIES